MIKHADNSQTAIIERVADYEPPRTFRSWLIGRPLSTADASHQTIGKVVGLAVFASDALSSTAYATQEILGVIAAAGTIAYGYLFPISLAIITLLAIVTISYEQTIHAYPGGGGAYIVARDNLGELPAQTAGAALLTDYILTVSVSISAGVAQIVSAYPGLFPYRVLIAVIAVFFIMLILFQMSTWKRIHTTRSTMGVMTNIRNNAPLVDGSRVARRDSICAFCVTVFVAFWIAVMLE